MSLIFEPGALRKLFGSEYSQIDTLAVDILSSEKESQREEIIDKPAEDGDVKTLGSITQPLVLTISGIFNDNRTTGESWSDKKEKLESVKKTKEPFTVACSLGVYESMLFESIDYDRSSGNKGGLFFTATLRQVTLISTKTVSVPSNYKKNGAKKDLGKIQPKEAPEAADTRGFYTKILDGLGF